MDKERLAEIEQLLKIAEDELSYLQQQRHFLLDQIACLNRERKNLLHPVIEESHSQYYAIHDEQVKVSDD